MPRSTDSAAARLRLPLVSLLFVLTLALGLCPWRPASAQSATDSATAEALFNEGLALLGNQKTAEACRKLEESQRLDPGVGTLLYLADCYQQLGRTASAWATFREAAYLAKDKADDREPMAVEYARTLEPKLSYLTLEVTADPSAGFSIQHDGKPVGQALWGTAFPVDPGSHTIEARAPGKQPWSQTLNIAEGSRQERVVVPVLLDEAPVPPVVVPVPPPRAEPRAVSHTQKTVGWVLLGVGGGAVVTSGVLALLARGDDSDAEAKCRPDRITLCSPAGVELGESAATKATWAGVTAGVGLAALAAGVTLLLTAPESPSEAAPALALRATFQADAGQLFMSARW